MPASYHDNKEAEFVTLPLRFSRKKLALAFCIAIAAVYRPPVAWFKRNLGFFAAGSTHCREHLPLTTGFLYAQPLLFSRAACRTPFGVIGETFFGIEFLLGCGESKIRLAICAGKSSVLIAQG